MRHLFTRSARKSLDSLDTAVKRRMAPVVNALANEPRPVGCLKVKTEDGVWRIRVGDYRIGYEIDDECLIVRIIRVGHPATFTTDCLSIGMTHG
ncbi:MAG: type II toxin-antitoxin system RelE/ParE family toxin [Armatimonadetes bacterium]|nr:type II toxin-antitoxin system RelE/ParE family toxin [Armatimonadota bacterium]